LGIATAVTEMVFRHLRAVCEGRGGTLTLADLDTAQSQGKRSFAGASGFFEATHARCMQASAAGAPSMFARENILSSLLFVCGHKAARPAYAAQVTRFGEVWLNQYFDGMAEFVRRAICADADDRLRQVYAALSGELGARLTINDLMREKQTRAILQECVAPLFAPDAPDRFAAPMSDLVSEQIAAQRGIPKPDLSKVTEQEMRKFLGWLPRQMHVALTATGGDPTAERPLAGAEAAVGA
jgi:hypothetical protein